MTTRVRTVTETCREEAAAAAAAAVVSPNPSPLSHLHFDVAISCPHSPSPKQHQTPSLSLLCHLIGNLPRAPAGSGVLEHASLFRDASDIVNATFNMKTQSVVIEISAGESPCPPGLQVLCRGWCLLLSLPFPRTGSSGLSSCTQASTYHIGPQGYGTRKRACGDHVH